MTLLLPPDVEMELVTADQTTGGVRLVVDSTRNEVDDAVHERLNVPLPPPPLVHPKFTAGGGLVTVTEASCNICHRKASVLASVTWNTGAKLVVAPPVLNDLPLIFD